MDLTAVTINLCAITAAAKLDALLSYLKSHKVDIAMLQEVAVPAFNFPGYQEVVNMGEKRRGTAILVRTSLPMDAPLLLPSGRATRVQVGALTCVNLYAPSGARQRAERAEFFSREVTPLLASAGGQLLVGGDFNCVLQEQDSTGTTPRSSELAAAVKALRLTDAWTSLRHEPGHSFFAGGMSARLDRMYASPALAEKLEEADTTAVPFSDHHAVKLKLKHSEGRTGLPGKSKASWTLDNRILQDPAFMELLAGKMREWRAKQRKYASLAEWWVKLVKPQVRGLAADFTSDLRAELKRQTEFLQHALQELCAKDTRTAADNKTITEIKKEIIELHALKLRGVLDRSKLDSIIADEPVTMHHIANMNRRSRQQDIQRLETTDGEVLTGGEVPAHFLETFKAKFSKPAGGGSTMLDELDTTLDAGDNAELVRAFTEEEVAKAIKKSPKHKSPGEDGLTAEFYQAMLPVILKDITAIFNEMWRAGEVPEDFMKGVIVMLPKKKDARLVTDFRPITLLNVDMKVFARVQAARLTKVADKLLHPNQVRPGGKRNMAGALCDLRDVLSALGALQQPGCVLSVDFSGAFDNVNHDFLFQALAKRGLHASFIAVLRSMYRRSSSRIRVNGELTACFFLERSVRQGCPLSALLFAVVLAALCCYLERRLQGLQLAVSRFKVSAYADDAMAVLRTVQEVGVCNAGFEVFAVEAGLAVNPIKCGVLPVGGWDSNANVGYPVVDSLKVLGLYFSADVKDSISTNWKHVVAAVQGVLASNTARALSLQQRAEFVSVFALAKLWHAAQVLPLPDKCAEQLQKAVSMFMFKGSLFRLKAELCCQPRSKGGLGVPDLALKAHALFAGRWESLLHVDPDGLAAEWLQLLLRQFGVGNPPNCGAVWPAAAHFRAFQRVRAYCAPPRLTPEPKALIRELLRVLEEAAVREQHRVEAQHPAVDWTLVWANLSSAALPREVQEAWFVVTHDLVATNHRLFGLQDRKRRHATGLCARCGGADTLLHRLAECGGASSIWRWLQGPLRRLTGQPPRPSWLLRPDVTAPSDARKMAAVWLLGQVVHVIMGTAAPQLADALSAISREREKVRARPGVWPAELVQGLELRL